MNADVPVQLGRYQILARIGEGGMASVFLARQRGPQGFEKLLVIKRIHPNLARVRQFTNMFLDEARIAAQINHHNVVQIFELGEDQGSYFIAMEYLEGESLATLLTESARRRERLAPGVVARIVADAAAGLHAAHELTDIGGEPLQVVHRDVSPANVFVLFEGGVKVVDFGVAKAKGRYTETIGGEIKGKFAYMSPEQLTNGEVDRRADVFALGVVLWEGLVMKRLFRRDSPGATVSAVLGERITPPSTIDPNIPPAIEAVAMRALHRDPEERFATTLQMREALEDALHESTERIGARQISATMSRLFGDRLARRRDFLEHISVTTSVVDGSDVFAIEELDEDPFDITTPDAPSSAPARLEAPPALGVEPPPPSSSFLDISTYEAPPRPMWPWIVGMIVLVAALSVGLAVRERTSSEVEAPPALAEAPEPAPPPEPPKQEQLPAEPSEPDEGPEDEPTAESTSKVKRPRARFGKLFLATVPRSTVYEGKRRLGDTPLVGVRIRAGRHRLTLVRADDESQQTLEVVIKPSEDTRLVHRFE